MLKTHLLKSTSIRFACILLASFVVTNCNMSEQSQTDLAQAVIEEAEAIIEPWVSDAAPGVAVAISLNDEVVFARGAGMANLEHDQNITPESVFLVGSVSKQFAAFATLLLVSEGEIELDVDIRTYIPEMNEAPRVITVRHLLDHMSGLRERNLLAAMAGWMEDDIQTEAQLMELVVRQHGVNFLAGEKFEYSNTGYALLAEIVKRVSGQSFQSFMDERIFQPLDMSQTRFPKSRNDLILNLASSYYAQGENFKKVVAASEAMGSTGLYTTAIDLLKWQENFETQIVGNDLVFDMMAERAIAANGASSTFAKGQELRVYKGLETWSHGGTDAGYRSFILRIPSEDFEISILSNRRGFDTAKMAFALVDTFLKDSKSFKNLEPIEFETATATDLAAYAGDYEFYPGTIFSLRAEKNGLTFSMLGADRENLEPLVQIDDGEFMLNPRNDLSLKFSNPENGLSKSVDYKIGLHGTLKAERLNLKPFDPQIVNLKDYLGSYMSDELEAYYTLSIKDGQLSAKHLRLPAFGMISYQQDTFSGLAGPLQKVEFIRDEKGDVTGFYASAPVAESIEFIRMK